MSAANIEGDFAVADTTISTGSSATISASTGRGTNAQQRNLRHAATPATAHGQPQTAGLQGG
jgi:hypothetical protein